MWLCDLHTKKWTTPNPVNPVGGCPQLRGVAGYYDVARNVKVIYSKQESWVYRGTKR